MLMRGNVDFRNSSRYSALSEKTFSRQFGEPSDFAEFNMIGTQMVVMPHILMIAATDRSFIPKSGSDTYGLAGFYNGSRSESEKGLEISELAVVDISYNTAYSLSAWQTPAEFGSEHTRTDRYAEHFMQDAPCLPPSVRYVAADGYYAGKKSADGMDFHFNACMTALNLMKRESCRIAPSEEHHVCSVASVKIRNFNEYLIKRFCNMSGPDFSSIKSSDAYNGIINIGAIAA